MKPFKTIALSVVILAALAATPAFAQLEGTWAGDGKGCCYPRPDAVIYPWQTWKGEVYTPPEQDTPIFEGTWYDELGNYGTFKGNVYFPPIEEQAIAEGEWTWFDPLSMSPGPKVGGKFKMTFWFLEGHCSGTWTTIWPSPSDLGTMEGKKVD